MAFSSDTDLEELVPDILELGIESFAGFHADAQADIERDIRTKWWSKTGYSGEMDATLLTDSQFTKAASYLVLWKYALPQLTNWVDGDRFQSMIAFYKSRYSEEIESIYADGVEYDYNEDSTVSESERSTTVNRLVR